MSKLKLTAACHSWCRILCSVSLCDCDSFQLSFQNLGGLPEGEKAGVMRRVSMAVLKATARHTLRGLEIITPQAMHTHTARRARSEAAREADFDEHRWDPRAFGCAGHDERTP